MSNRPINDLDQQQREVDRRLGSVERRAVPTNASDLLGPGYAPRSVQTLDWNAEECLFAGQFYSPIGAINSPDSSMEWMGITMAEDDTYTGVQHVWSAGMNVEARQLSRRWYSPDGGESQVYTPWVGDYPWTPLPISSPYLPGNFVPEVCATVGGLISYRGHVTPDAGSGSWSLNNTRTLVAAGGVPEPFRPVGGASMFFLATLGGASIARLQVFVDGSIDLINYDTTGTYVSLNAISYVRKN